MSFSQTIRTAKFGFSLLTAILALPVILDMPVPALWQHCAVLSFFATLAASSVVMRRQSWVIVGVLTGVAVLILPQPPSAAELVAAGDFVLVFGCLLPVLSLTRATALTMPSVHNTQALLASLPAHASASGLQLTSHILGGVMNIGTFSLISASIPQNADTARRRLAAEATLRGMNAAVIWSPFFVSFAVAGVYLPAGYAAKAILVGIFTASVFFIISVIVASPRQPLSALITALKPLQPVASRLVLIFLSVIVVGWLFGLTALLAVIVTMPVLCLVQMGRRPALAPQILSNFTSLQKQSGDDLVIISMSMIIASLASATPALDSILGFVFGDDPKVWLMIISLPVCVWAGSVLSIHPVISSAILLAFFAPSLTVFDAIFVMQAHMIGSSAGTMSSISSMSIITVASQFRLPAVTLAFGPNLIYSGALAVCGGLFWAGFYQLMI